MTDGVDSLPEDDGKTPSKRAKEYPHLVRTGSDRYSFLYHHSYLRNVVRAVMEVDGISMRKLYRETGVHYSDISRWLNFGKSKDKGKRAAIRALPDISICKIAEYLGLELELNIKMKSNG